METANITLPETLTAAIQELLRGQDSAKKLRDLLSAVSSGALKLLKEEEEEGRGGGGGSPSRRQATAQDLLGDVLWSFNSTLSILNCGDLDEFLDEFSQVPPASRRNAVKPEESEESSKSSATKGRRGCYKRRKSSDSWMKLSPNLADDGHQWRKYGQKSILNTNFPRSYFRCTHKPDQGCRATKQVQKISNDPPMFRTTYSGQHTCQKLLKAPQIFMADSNPQDSSVLLSFETDQPLDGANGRISSNADIHFSTVKCETKDDIITDGVADVSHNQSSSTEYDLFPSPDFTLLGSTVGSGQGEALSSSHSFHSDMDLMIDEVDFEDMFACPFS